MKMKLNMKMIFFHADQPVDKNNLHKRTYALLHVELIQGQIVMLISIVWKRKKNVLSQKLRIIIAIYQYIRTDFLQLINICVSTQ